jgi:hypothetical protein
MRKANVIQGRIQEHAAGVGTANDDEVQKRAREIAITNGRRPGEVNESDVQQARQELRAAQNAPPRPGQDPAELVSSDDPLDVPSGREAPTRVATDEQTLPERLVAEGVDEAVHEQMVEGNRRSRRQDATYSDQLPSNGE